MGRSDQCSAFTVHLKLERQDQSQIKSTQFHPVGESAAGDLTKRYQLTHMRGNTVPNFVKKGGWDMIRSIFTVSYAGHCRSSTYRQSSSFQDLLNLFCTYETMVIGRRQRRVVSRFERKFSKGRSRKFNRRCTGAHPSTWASGGRTGRKRTCRVSIHEPFSPWR